MPKGSLNRTGEGLADFSADKPRASAPGAPLGPSPLTGAGWKRSRWTEARGHVWGSTRPRQGLWSPITGPRSAFHQESPSASSQMAVPEDPAPREAASGIARQREMLLSSAPLCALGQAACLCLDGASELWQRSWSQPSGSGKPRPRVGPRASPIGLWLGSLGPVFPPLLQQPDWSAHSAPPTHVECIPNPATGPEASSAGFPTGPGCSVSGILSLPTPFS